MTTPITLTSTSGTHTLTIEGGGVRLVRPGTCSPGTHAAGFDGKGGERWSLAVTRRFRGSRGYEAWHVRGEDSDYGPNRSPLHAPGVGLFVGRPGTLVFLEDRADLYCDDSGNSAVYCSFSIPAEVRDRLPQRDVSRAYTEVA